MKDKVFIACDFTRMSELESLCQELKGSGCGIKIGMEIFYSLGPKAVEYAAGLGFKIFLDLKLHDIPNTVGQSLKVLSQLPITITNVHAAGGAEMMRRAQEAMANGKLIAVTMLTSTSQAQMQEELGIKMSLDECVLHYASMAKKSGLAGVVCSPHEVKLIKQKLGSDFLCVTPGVRPKGSDAHDQKRVMSPLEAIQSGSDYLVVGRTITGSANPRKSLEELFKD